MDALSTTKRRGREAGLWYLLLALTAPFGLVYVPQKIVVAGDAAATSANVRSSETLLRLGIASELAHQVVCIFLVLALYRLFKSVSERLASQLVILGALVSVPIVFVNVLNELAAIAFARGPAYLDSLGGPQRDGLAYLMLQLHDQGIQVVSIFWGLWLLPFGRLAIASRFVPPPLGALLVIAGIGYLASSVTALLAPQYGAVVAEWTMPLKLGELPMVVWLVGWGAREPAG
jgi:hypothetical protein